MAKQTTYKQCKLERDGVSTTSWLPVRFAKKGKALKLMTDGWIVVSVGSTELGHETVALREREHIHHRDVTDI